MVWGAESPGAGNLALRLSGRVTGQVTAALSLSLLGCKFGPSRGRGLIIKEDNKHGKAPCQYQRVGPYGKLSVNISQKVEENFLPLISQGGGVNRCPTETWA